MNCLIKICIQKFLLNWFIYFFSKCFKVSRNPMMPIHSVHKCLNYATKPQNWEELPKSYWIILLCGNVISREDGKFQNSKLFWILELITFKMSYNSRKSVQWIKSYSIFPKSIFAKVIFFHQLWPSTVPEQGAFWETKNIFF